MATSVQIQDIPTVAPVDALWTLIQGQSKSVQKALKERLEALFPAKTKRKTFSNELTPELLARIEKAREEIRRGECVTVHSVEENRRFLETL